MTPDGSGMALDVQVLSLNGPVPHCEHVDALSTTCTGAGSERLVR